MTRPFRFGVTAGEVGDARAWHELARRTEDAGYATLLLPDTTRSAAPLPALASAAAVTSTLHVGTWVLCEPLRNPAQLAWEVRTLHDLYGDRVEIGLGAGRPGAEQDAAGLVAVGDTATPWLDRLGTSAADLAAADAVTVVCGSARAMADTLLRRRDELGISYLTVPASALDEFAPVVARLVGR